MAIKKETTADRMKTDPKEALGAEPGSSSQGKIHKEVQKSIELLEKYQRAREVWGQHFLEDQKFRAGAQWTEVEEQELRRRGQAALVVNRIHPIVETAKALLTYNNPQFRSSGREDSDTRTAKIFADLCQWVWEISNGNEVLKECIDDYYVGGMGYLMVYQDPNADMGKGEVLMQSVYPLDVYVDPNSRDRYFNDAAHILISRLVTDEQAEKMYPQYMNIIKKASSTQADRYPGTDLKATEGQLFLGDDYDDTAVVKREYIERYTRVRIPMYHVFEEDTGYENMMDDDDYSAYLQKEAALIVKGDEVTYVTSADQVTQISSIIDTYGEINHMRHTDTVGAGGQMQQAETIRAPGPEEGDPNAIPGSEVKMAIVTIGQLVNEDKIIVNTLETPRIKVVVSVGDKLLYTRIMPIEEYPIVPLCNVHLRNPFPLSDVRIYKPLQRYINKIRSLIVAHASTSTNVKLLIPRGSVDKKAVEEEWGRAGTAVIEFDGEIGQPIVAGPVPLPNELYKNEADAKYDLEYGFGVHDIMMGSAQNQPSTFRGTIAIDEYGQRRSKSRQSDMEAFLKQIFTVAVPLMQQIYTEEKVIRLVQPDGRTTEATVNQPLYDQFTMEEMGRVHDVTVGRYDIIPVAGSTLPSNRFAQLETYMQMFQAGIIDQLEVLKKTEVVDTEGVMQRMSMINQLQQQLQASQEEIKRLTGDLQTAEREEIHAKKRLEVEKSKTNLKDSELTARKATQLYEARLGDSLSNLQQNMVESGEA